MYIYIYIYIYIYVYIYTSQLRYNKAFSGLDILRVIWIRVPDFVIKIVRYGKRWMDCIDPNTLDNKPETDIRKDVTDIRIYDK
jgi:hypothetical protein